MFSLLEPGCGMANPRKFFHIALSSIVDLYSKFKANLMSENDRKLSSKSVKNSFASVLFP